MSQTKINKKLEKLGVSGFFTNSPVNKVYKERILKLSKLSAKDLKLTAKRNYNINLYKNEKKKLNLKSKKELFNEIVKNLKKQKKNIRQTIGIVAGNDSVIELDSFKSGRHVRVITKPKVKTIEGFYDKVNYYRAKFEKEGWHTLLITAFFKNDNDGKIEYRHINYKYYFNSLDSYDTIDDLTGEPIHVEGLRDWYYKLVDDIEVLKAGSDKIDDRNYTPDFSKFDMILHKVATGKGDIFKKNYFVYEPIKDFKKGLCGLKCLQGLECDINEESYINDNLADVYKMQNFLKYIPNSKIFGNCLSLKRTFLNDEYDKTTKDPESGKMIKIKKITMSDVQLCYYENGFQKMDGADNLTGKFLLYDIEEKHYEYCKELKLLELYSANDGTFYKFQDKKLKKIAEPFKFDKTLIEYNMIKSEVFKERYIIFDYETVTDWEHQNVNKEYSLSIMDVDIDDLQTLDIIEKENDILALEKFKKKHCKLFLGYDCSKQFIDYILKNQNSNLYFFISFNGANFDNYIFYNACLKNLDNYKIGNPIIANGQLLNFQLYGRHNFFDMRKHLVGSLKANCESFGIKLCAKIEGFSHYEMQKKYNDGTLLSFIQTSKELRNYNIHDCLALGVIFYRYVKAMENIFNFKDSGEIPHDCVDEENNIIEPKNKISLKKNVVNYMTLGQMIMDVFDTHLKESNIKMAKFYVTKKHGIKEYIRKYNLIHKKKISDDPATLKKHKDEILNFMEEENKRLLVLYNDIKNNRIAGRVELFNGVQLIEENIKSLDVCSLYPYIMFVFKGIFPSGEICFVDNINEAPKDKMGFYYCDVDQSKMTVNILAGKTKEGNNWKQTKFENILLSKVMIKYIQDNGGKVKTYHGCYFTSMTKNIDMFRFLLDIMQLKNEQDVYNKTKDSKYNQVLRELYKLILNILSGKLNQKLNRDKREIVNSYEFDNLCNDKDKVKELNTIIFSGDRAHVVYKITEEQAIRTCKPIYVGTMIYDYARIYMHSQMYSKVPYEQLVYTDTDSNKLRDGAFKKWVEEYGSKTLVNHWPEVEKVDDRYIKHHLYEPNSKVFGSFEDEYKGYNMNLNYFEQKKTYLCCDKEKYDKLKNDYIDDKINDEQYNKLSKEYCMFHFKGISANDLIVNDLNDKLTNQELCDMYNDPNAKRISDDYVEFFENLHNDKKAKIMSCALQKSHNNNKKNTKFNETERLNNNCYHIITSYRIKNITIKS